MTTYGTLVTALDTPVIPANRHRHTPENDRKTAQIKRINRLYAAPPYDCDRVVRTGRDGITRLYVKSTGACRSTAKNFGLPVDPAGSLNLDYLEKAIRGGR